MVTVPVVEIVDKRKGIIAAVAVLLLLFLYLFFKTLVMADPPPSEIPLKTETPFTEIEIKNLVVEAGGASGSGTPSDAPISDPKLQTHHVLTKPKNPNSHTTSGQSTNHNSPNSNNSSSSTSESNNPFGSGGNGGGDGAGKDGPFGNDVGPDGNGNDGNGNGSGEGRKRLNKPNVDHIQTNVPIVVVLKLTINADGNVISAVSTSKTTTTDQRIINQVISAVKSQVKYNKDPGAGMAFVFLSVNISAT